MGEEVGGIIAPLVPLERVQNDLVPDAVTVSAGVAAAAICTQIFRRPVVAIGGGLETPVIESNALGDLVV